MSMRVNLGIVAAASISSKFMPRTTWERAARLITCSAGSDADYPISVHGVGLSIGGAEPLDREHLERLKALIDRYQPAMFSEHLAWSTHDGVFLNDLLPLPYNRATLQRVCAHIDQVQDKLGRRMLLENPSTYVQLESSDYERNRVPARSSPSHRLWPAARRQ